MMRKLLCVMSVLALSLVGRSQEKKYWLPVADKESASDLFEGRFRPSVFSLYRLEEDLFGRVMEEKGSDITGKRLFELQVPAADGKPETFLCHASPVMDPALADRYPGIYAFVGQSQDDPQRRIYFDYSLRGFHAMILSADKPTRYIDPVGHLDNIYVAYSRAAMEDVQTTFECQTVARVRDEYQAQAHSKGADDGRLRTYRLALACTGEYARYFLNGFETSDAIRKTKVLAAMNTLLVRTNAIFERDFGIHLNLIAGNDALIYLNPATDPWSTEWNNQTQRTIDAVVGNGGYDIGHLLHKEAAAGNNNGNAGCIGCVCVSGSKGSAFTSHVTPEGDPFVVDYTAHEMGHQFGANHTFTFNTETGTSSQFEPGSGSTIMGYAGITGATDVQPHSDDYFHARSIEQVTNYVKGATGGSCALLTSTNNSVPVISLQFGYTIPVSTPFTLTASASDANTADVLTYTWEQLNAGTASSTYPSATATAGPLFRSRNNSSQPGRMFPELASILDGSNGNTWEKLPAVGRTLNFRLTVRDNHPGGGANQAADVALTVLSSAGPFLVTAPNTSVTWTAGTMQTISWSVNNTALAPINCSSVKISLSTDGGLSFPTILTSATANDGTETLLIPNLPTTKARIKVEAVGNIFFDISNVNFTILTGTACGTPGSLAASSISSSGASLSWASVSAAQTYELGYKTTSSSTWQTVSAVSGITYVMTGLQANTTYNWRVRSNCSGVLGNYASAQFTTLASSTCISAYEPNESIAVAKSIVANTMITSAITSAADHDFFKLAVSGSSNISISLTGLPADYDMYFYNSAGTLLATATTGGLFDENISLVNQAAGSYFIEVFGYNGVFNSSVCYSLKTILTPFTGCAGSYDNSSNGTSTGAPLVPFNTNIYGLINPSGDVDLYKFTIKSPGTINLTLSNLPVDYDLQLLNSSGVQVAISQNGSTTAEAISYTAAAGTYYARVYGFSSAYHVSNCYLLKLVPGTASRNDKLTDTVPVFSFDLAPNPVKDWLRIQVNQQLDISPCSYEVRSITGQRIMQGTFWRKEEWLDMRALPGGVYYISLIQRGKVHTRSFIRI